MHTRKHVPHKKSSEHVYHCGVFGVKSQMHMLLGPLSTYVGHLLIDVLLSACAACIRTEIFLYWVIGSRLR